MVRKVVDRVMGKTSFVLVDKQGVELTEWVYPDAAPWFNTCFIATRNGAMHGVKRSDGLVWSGVKMASNIIVKGMTITMTSDTFHTLKQFEVHKPR